MVKSAQEAAGVAPEVLAKYEPVIGSRGLRCSAWGTGPRFAPYDRKLFAQPDEDGPASIVEVTASGGSNGMECGG
jgi:hypothetical protein